MPQNISKIQAAVMQALADPPRRRKKINAAKKRALKQKTAAAPVIPVDYGHFKQLKDRGRKKPRVYAFTLKQVRKKALKLSEEMLEKFLSDPSLTGPEGDRDKTIAFLVKRIAGLKATRAAVKPEQRKKQAKACTKVKRKDAPLMDLNPRHHKTKVYISPEQRAINKHKDGVATLTKPVHNNLMGIRLVGSPEPIVNKYVPNPTPRTRKERLKHWARLTKALGKPKYPPYNRGVSEVVSKAA